MIGFKQIIKEEIKAAAQETLRSGSAMATERVSEHLKGAFRKTVEEVKKEESTPHSIWKTFATSVGYAIKESVKFTVSAFVAAGRDSLYTFALRSALRTALRV